MALITLYAVQLKDKSVQIYKDKEKQIKEAFYPSHLSNKPDKRNKYITLNCFRFKIEWI